MTASSDLSGLATALGESVRWEESLSLHTAMRVGGPADLLIVCNTVSRVIEAVRLARLHGVPWRVFGGGCNVLAADSGLRGLVIINRAAGIVFDGDSMVRAEAGALLAVLSREAVARGLAGLEWASGLPGTVGGAVVGNAGAFDGDIASVLRGATVLGPDHVVVDRPNEWFEFGYRRSRYKPDPGAARRSVVLEATFELRPDDPEGLAVRALEILNYRKTRHPSGATMGSTFKNPAAGHAGYLVEQAGLCGHRVGGARVSTQHGNFLMNAGDATAADVLTLIDHVRAAVQQKQGVAMELEIELVGAW